jgi:hypothetical protein
VRRPLAGPASATVSDAQRSAPATAIAVRCFMAELPLGAPPRRSTSSRATGAWQEHCLALARSCFAGRHTILPSR